MEAVDGLQIEWFLSLFLCLLPEDRRHRRAIEVPSIYFLVEIHLRRNIFTIGINRTKIKIRMVYSEKCNIQGRGTKSTGTSLAQDL